MWNVSWSGPTGRAHFYPSDHAIPNASPNVVLARSLPHAVAGGSDLACGNFQVELPVFGASHGETR